MINKITLSSAAAILLVSTGAALAQSTGASPADPNNERNQRPAMSNTQPSDPATDDASARVPTDPNDAMSAEREEGGATGESSGDIGAGVEEPAVIAPESPSSDVDAETPPQAAP
ncbi:MAG: hypothetical protein Q7T86_14145 [Hyphomicrobiaceae bacterium]|nr:hypothetical protein [Hyphomicrobiaceae bacterium]